MSRHKIVVDIGYGDAGKGATVDYLCSVEPIRAVIRFNGGAQAAHNVVTPDGRHHTFAQFGSGSFHDGVRTHLSRFMLLNPLALVNEANHLIELGVTDIWERLTVDDAALVTTPFHIAVNQARERARGAGRHGSTGMGIGETQHFANEFPMEALRARDLCDFNNLLTRLHFLVGHYQRNGFEFDLHNNSVRDIAAHLFEAARRINIVGPWETGFLLEEGPCVFEGAQGVLLDEVRGFHPYTTWSNTTFDNAEALLREAGVDREDWTRIGVMRAYMTRHGAGPFVTEDDDLFSEFVEMHNGTGEFQGSWRVGHLDLVALRYALDIVGNTDEIYVTHLDQAERSAQLRYCAWYEAESGVGGYSDIGLRGRRGDLVIQESVTNEMLHEVYPILQEFESSKAIVDTIRRALQLPVTIVAYGPTSEERVPVHSLAAGVL